MAVSMLVERLVNKAYDFDSKLDRYRQYNRSLYLDYLKNISETPMKLFGENFDALVAKAESGDYAKFLKQF